MKLVNIIKHLKKAGVTLQLVGDKLECKLPKEGLSKDLRDELINNKEEIKNSLELGKKKLLQLQLKKLLKKKPIYLRLKRGFGLLTK